MTTQEVWTTYHKDLKRFIISKTKDEVIADDILQDAFIRIHNKLDTLKDASKLKSWIFTITRNAIYDHFKSQGKNITFDNSDIPVEIEDHIHTEKDCLRGIVTNLPKKYRTPLFLADIKGLKQQEIASQLNLPLPTVKSQIQRARKMIVQGFMDCCGFKLNENGKLVGEIQPKEDCKICNS
ncbi:sigma-70 family RNA polymerase sigma factor [Tenacibaculum sp. 190524A05c]|jgi:RNA polymerase sigma-70 factor (ECF subfamily)|uniref:sigma-70 family RNA polymerase sigma factor n=1 Tax=Tenacibaculum platacis TaxID=3137852 RepID=UPI0031FB58E0